MVAAKKHVPIVKKRTFYPETDPLQLKQNSDGSRVGLE